MPFKLAPAKLESEAVLILNYSRLTSHSISQYLHSLVNSKLCSSRIDILFEGRRPEMDSECFCMTVLTSPLIEDFRCETLLNDSEV